MLKEISLIIPKDIQLLELSSKGNSLITKAKIYNDKYLGVLNSFLLNLDNSEFIKFDDVDLKEIKSSNSNTKDKKYLFEINTRLSTNYSQINKNYLIKLGSLGLFNRLNLLNTYKSDS